MRTINLRKIKLRTVDKYLIRQFLGAFLVSLFVATALFLTIDFFEKTKVLFREDANFFDFLLYLMLKVPLIIHFMIPVAVLLGVLFSIGRLSQLSEITALRACGLSVVRLITPLVICGSCIALFMFILGETIVPWSSEKVEEIYNFDIKRKGEKGALSQVNYWYRSDNKLINMSFYDSAEKRIKDLIVFEVGSDFKPQRRVDASLVKWQSDDFGWLMNNVMEYAFVDKNVLEFTRFKDLPLVIAESPEDLYKLRRTSESMNYLELSNYIEKLQSEGVPVSRYLVEKAAKVSFPLVNIIVVIIAFPFALVSARSGAVTVSFMVGITVGLSYYFVHAVCMSLGAAELLPPIQAAWSANLLLCSLGTFFLLGAES